MRTDNLPKVLERRASTDKTQAHLREGAGRQNLCDINRLSRGKDHCEGNMLDVRNAEGRLHVGRKERQHDVWAPPIDPHDPWGPGDDRHQ